MQKQLMGSVLALFGALLVIFGFYTSFEIYVMDKITKSYESIGYFLVKLLQGETFVNLPDRSSVGIVLKTPDGKVYATQNVNLPMDKEIYYSFQGNVNGYNYTLLVRSISLAEYFEYVSKNPTILGISLAGLILILISIYSNSIQSPAKPQDVRERLPTQGKYQPEEELINYLKALRLTLATSKIISKESLEKAKEIIDKIMDKVLKRRGG